MGTITLPNGRASSDFTFRVKLKDGGLFIDWTELADIKAYLYSDAQKALAGRCTVSVDSSDNTILVCEYAATKPQYIGINSIIVRAKYHGRDKTYDKPAVNIVPRTFESSGSIILDDPIVDIELVVEDVSSSILDNILASCIDATAAAEAAAEEARLMVDIHRGPQGPAGQDGQDGQDGKSAYEIAVEEGFEGNETQWLASLKGDPGENGVGFSSTSTPSTPDGSFIITLTNGDTITVDMSHDHPGYYSKVVETTQPEGGFLPDVIYNLGTISGAVTFALANAVSGNANHYFWMFDTSTAAVGVTWPSGITWAAGSAPTVTTSKHYEVSVLGGVACYLEV